MLNKFRQCVLCKVVFEGWGHNPYPLADKGDCCNGCNIKVVIARMERIRKGNARTKEEGR